MTPENNPTDKSASRVSAVRFSESLIDFENGNTMTPENNPTDKSASRISTERSSESISGESPIICNREEPSFDRREKFQNWIDKSRMDLNLKHHTKDFLLVIDPDGARFAEKDSNAEKKSDAGKESKAPDGGDIAADPEESTLDNIIEFWKNTEERLLAEMDSNEISAKDGDTSQEKVQRSYCYHLGSALSPSLTMLSNNESLSQSRHDERHESSRRPSTDGSISVIENDTAFPSGTTALHLLTNKPSLLEDNETTLGSFDSSTERHRCPIAEYKLTSFLMEEIIPAYPKALITARNGPVATTDETDSPSSDVGYLPFEEAIKDWILSVNPSLEPPPAVDIRRKSFVPKLAADRRKSQVPKFNQINLPFHIKWCFRMISKLIEQEKSSSDTTDVLHVLPSCQFSIPSVGGGRTEMLSYSAFVIQRIASMPGFIKALLHIEDEEDRDFVFGTSLVQGVILQSESIGPWLEDMLASINSKVHRLAVYYIMRLSMGLDSQKNFERSKKTNYNYNSSLISRNGTKDQKETHKTLETKIYRKLLLLDNFLPNLIKLEEKAKEAVATTNIVQKLLDEKIQTPFSLWVLFYEMLFIVALFYYFWRLCIVAVNDDCQNSYKFDLSCSSEVVYEMKPDSISFYVCITCICYFLFMELSHMCASMHISMDLYWSKYYRLWNFINILVIVPITIFLVLHRKKRLNNKLIPLFCLTQLILCLKLLGFVRTINTKLATFVLSLIQIARDMVWFMVILLIFLFSFTMMFTISNGNPELQESFMIIYYMIFGEFAVEDFQKGKFVLFLTFTFLVVILLLNVLIAIVGDSYAKSMVESKKLFGRARLEYVSEIVALEKFLLQPKKIYTKLIGFVWFATIMGLSGYCLYELIQLYQIKAGKKRSWYLFDKVIMPILLFLLLTQLVAGFSLILGQKEEAFTTSEKKKAFKTSKKKDIEKNDMEESEREVNDREGNCRDRMFGILCIGKGIAKLVDATVQRLMRKLMGTCASTLEQKVDNEWTGIASYIDSKLKMLVAKERENAKGVLKGMESRMSHEIQVMDKTMQTMQNMFEVKMSLLEKKCMSHEIQIMDKSMQTMQGMESRMSHEIQLMNKTMQTMQDMIEAKMNLLEKKGV